MTEIDIEVAPGDRDDDVVTRVDRAVEACGLTVTMKGTLKAYPGCTHWHCKKGRGPGTLEITYWPTKRRLWLKVVESRRGGWMEAVIPRLLHELRGSRVSSPFPPGEG